MEYHNTKDIRQVKQLLKARNINFTLIYAQLVNFEDEDEFHVKTVKTLKKLRNRCQPALNKSKTTMASQCFAKESS